MLEEETKALNGHAFNSLDSGLLEIKRNAHRLSHQYGETVEEEIEKRKNILLQLLAKVGDNYNFQGPIFFNYGIHTQIGKNFFANYNLTVLDDAEIIIGNDVLIGPNCTLASVRHPLLADERITHKYADLPIRFCKGEKIVIEDNVWLAANVTVTGGVVIGKNSVIGAGSVVTHDIPENCLAVGIPCQVVRFLSEKDHWSDLNY